MRELLGLIGLAWLMTLFIIVGLLPVWLILLACWLTGAFK